MLAPPLMKRDERAAILERRQKTLLRVWRTLLKKGTGCAKSTKTRAGLLETSATLKLLPPSESAIVVLKSRAEEDALVAQRTAELGGGFWGALAKAGRECRAPTTVGCVSAVSQGEP